MKRDVASPSIIRMFVGYVSLAACVTGLPVGEVRTAGDNISQLFMSSEFVIFYDYSLVRTERVIESCMKCNISKIC